MSFNEISSLRKSGRLKEAYTMAHDDLLADPDDIWNRRAMAWVLYDYAKQNATFDKQQQFLRCLEQIRTLSLPDNEQMYWDAVTWLLRGMVATVERNRNRNLTFFSSLFALIKPLPLPRPSESYSALMQTMLRLKTEWQQFPDFCIWWNLDNLRPEDYSPPPLPDSTPPGQQASPRANHQPPVGQPDRGNRPSLSLAERAIMALTKALLSQNRKEDLAWWLPRLQTISQKNPSYTYLPYYIARAHLALGHPDQVKESMKTFIRKKRGDFWVWELLGDATADPDTKFCLYARAMTSKTKDEMLVAMREKMVLQLIARQHFPEARHELDHLIATRQRNKWAISAQLQQLVAQEWYSQAADTPDIHAFYKPYAQKASELMNLNEQNETQAISGTLKKTKTGIGFVDTVFVPPFLISNIESGAKVTVKAVKTFDKKKNQWGWKAVKIKENT